MPSASATPAQSLTSEWPAKRSTNSAADRPPILRVQTPNPLTPNHLHIKQSGSAETGAHCRPLNNATPPPTNDALWDRLRATFWRVIAAVGAPAAIALLNLSTRGARLAVVRQLGMIESLVRKLLFAEIAALAPAAPERGPRIIQIPLRPGLVIVNPPRGRGPRAPRPLDLADPETWSASFALALPRDPRLVRDRHVPRIRALWGSISHPAEPPPPAAQHDRGSTSFRIARRFEALRRVLNDPAPHVRRLASAQRRALARSPQIVSRYALIGPRRSGYDPADVRLPLDIMGAALTTRSKLLDSS